MAKKAKEQAEKTVAVEQPVVKAIKAFNPDLTCTPNGVKFQYEIGKTYEIDGSIKICNTGFHACDENPFDLWNFYPVVNDDGKLTRYAITSHYGDIQREKDEKHSKIASAKITIDAELSLPDFIRRAVSWMIDATKNVAKPSDATDNNSGDYAQI